MSSLYLDPVNPQIASPVNLDSKLQTIQNALKTGLTWLTHSFPKATRAKEKVGDEIRIFPEVFRNDSDFRYVNLLPSRDLVNFSFFLLNDPAIYSDYTPFEKIANVTYNLDLVFWFDLLKIDNTLNYRFLELLKEDIIFIINQNPEINLINVVEGFDQVWAGFNLEEVEGQYFKQPYAGLKFNFSLTHAITCNTAINTYSIV